VVVQKQKKLKKKKKTPKKKKTQNNKKNQNKTEKKKKKKNCAHQRWMNTLASNFRKSSCSIKSSGQVLQKSCRVGRGGEN